jgi:TonB family protein
MLSALLLLSPLFAQEIAPKVQATAEPAPVEEPLPLTVMPELIQFQQAPYPEQALADQIEGQVGLLLELDETGTVTGVEILTPAGHGFDAAAVEAAKAFRFSPAEDATGPVPVAIEFAYGFVLDAAATEGAEPEEEIVFPVNLEGQAVEMVSRQALPEMAISVLELGTNTTTDENGRFEFRGLPAGKWTVQVSRPGWITSRHTLEVADGEVTSAKLWVKNANYGRNEAVGVYRRKREEVTRRTISVEEIRRIPGTMGDPIRVIQNLPGAARAPFGIGLLVIRGSNPEDSAVYIDGIRIPYIYHLGGLVSVLNSDIIQSVDYLPGGYSVRYGRSTGGVVDVTTRKEAPEQARMTWSTDVLDTGALFEGRFGKNKDHHFAVAARRSYIDKLLPLFLGEAGTLAKPRWMDYQMRYFHDSERPFTAFLFGFDDILFIGDQSDTTGQGGSGDTIGVHYFTHRGLINYKIPLGERLTLSLTPSMGVDGIYTNIGSDIRLDQLQYLFEARSEIEWIPNEKLTLLGGIDLLGGRGEFEVDLPFTPADRLGDDPLTEDEAISFGDKIWAWGPDFYLQAKWRPLQDPEALLIAPGLRTSFVQVQNLYQARGLDPRISTRVRLLPQTFLKAGTGIYTQPPQPFESWSPSGNVDLGMEKSWSSALGLEQRVGQANSIEIEGFYKTMWDLIVDNPNLTDPRKDQLFINEGLGRVYGLELMIRREPIGHFFGWISYTLSKSERLDYPNFSDEAIEDARYGTDNEWYPFTFDQTHIFVALGGYQMPYGIHASGRFSYVTGNPYTPYSLGIYDIDTDRYSAFPSGDVNSKRMAPYFALDLRIEKTWLFKSAKLDTYLELLNVVKGENPEFIDYNYDYTESRSISGLPFIPSIGFNLEVKL